jgi:hypothetical protein
MNVRPPKIPATYQALLASVKQTLIEGQKRIESERVRTYWETGRLIHGHVLEHKDRADYGAKVIENLARDLKVSSRQLRHCVQFAKEYERLPIVNARSQLGWTHFRQLMSVSDEGRRARLEEAVGRNGWSTKELAQKIKLGRDNKPNEEPEPKKIPPQSLLTPLRGELYTYRIVTRPTVGVGEDSGLLIDLGFGIFRECDSRAVVENDIVRSTKRDDGYRLSKIEATAAALFTYNGYVERVIDADTLKCGLTSASAHSPATTFACAGSTAPRCQRKRVRKPRSSCNPILRKPRGSSSAVPAATSMIDI